MFGKQQKQGRGLSDLARYSDNDYFGALHYFRTEKARRAQIFRNYGVFYPGQQHRQSELNQKAEHDERRSPEALKSVAEQLETHDYRKNAERHRDEAYQWQDRLGHLPEDEGERTAGQADPR